MEKIQEYLYPRNFKYFNVGMQILVIAFLFALYTAYAYYTYLHTGTIFGYSLRVSILFVPIYEEIIFRGVILIGLTRYFSTRNAIIISSLLFGLWHFKNIFFLPAEQLVHQMLYTTFIFGPIVAWITLRLKSIWPAIILHYLNNIAVPLFVVVFAWLQK